MKIEIRLDKKKSGNARAILDRRHLGQKGNKQKFSLRGEYSSSLDLDADATSLRGAWKVG